ncbi:MAG: tripartite tricarboxylate transporter substrate binding protein [Paucibacter sp.]|nr:tripartite tricarboxylate transporter substrate binding protein [Roseateles sp.]
MRNFLDKAIGIAALATALCGFSAPAAAAYPDQAVRMIIPFPPGGGTDVVARVICNDLSKTTGWTVVPDNRGGGGGSRGLGLAARAKNDGYSIVLAQNANMIYNPLLGTGQYDPVKDFQPIVLVASAPNVMVVPKDSPIKSFQELLALARANPGKLRFASPGVGTSAHLAGELLQQRAGIKVAHVAYQGTGEALRDVLGGRVDFYVASAPSTMPHLINGSVRALAVFADKRFDDLKDVPTLDELGIKNSAAVTWWGVAAPAGTPASVIALLNAKINEVLAHPATRAQLKAAGADPIGGTTAEFDALIKADLPKWGAIIKAANLQTRE